MRFGKQIGTYLKIRKQLQRIDLLVLDDWGLATLDSGTGYEIADLVEDRMGRLSTIVVSQFPITAWDQIFEDKTTADAVMDRLIHRAYPIELKGPSLRKEGRSAELAHYQNQLVEEIH